MKKILSVLGILLLGLTLVACSKEEDLPTIIIPSEDDKTHLVPGEDIDKEEDIDKDEDIKEEQVLTPEQEAKAQAFKKSIGENLKRANLSFYESNIDIPKFNDSIYEDIRKLKEEIDEDIKNDSSDLEVAIIPYKKMVKLLELSHKKGLKESENLNESLGLLYAAVFGREEFYFNPYDSVTNGSNNLMLYFADKETEEDRIKALNYSVFVLEEVIRTTNKK